MKKAKKFELCIIGAGNMGEAILSGLIKEKLFSPKDIAAVDISPERRKTIHAKYKISSTTDLSVIGKSKRILLSVKPQDLASLLESIDKYISKDTLIISIAAGKTIDNIKSSLSSDPPVARVMPNTPALVRRGISGVCFSRKATAKNRKDTIRILQSIGHVLTFKESMMNAVTAVSGSGPAYVFYFIEAFLESAKNLGFSTRDANELVLTTIKGTVELLEKTSLPPETLRKKVTSKGGTTEAALKVLEKNKWKKIFSKAVQAAERRGFELNRS